MPPRPRVRPDRRSPPPQIDHRCLPRPAEPVIDPEMPPVIHPGDEALHPFLRFTREEDRTDRDHLRRQAAEHGYHPHRYVVWDALQSVSLLGRAEALCGPHWRSLFSITDSVCQELAIEFFSTIHMTTQFMDYTREDALTFRLGGAERRLSIRQFAVLMGIYTQDDLDTPAFTEGLTDWPEGVTAYAFWQEIGTGPYGHPIPKSTRIVDPLHRILHRAVVHSFTSRSDTSSGTVTHSDLFYLYCMIRGRPCQIAERLAYFLFMVRRRTRVSQGIFGGGFVTRLARAMGIIPLDDTPEFTFTPQAIPIDRPMMIRMGMVRRSAGRYILLDSEGREWDPQRPPTPPRDIGGPEVAGPSTGGDMGAGPSGTAQEPPQTQMPSFVAPDPFASQQSPLRETHQRPPPQTEPTIVYQRRDTLARLDHMDAEIASLRASVSTLQARQEAGFAEILELQRLEYAHAEACRHYSFQIMRMMASGSTEPFPDPPSPPQRLRDFIAGTSQSHPQPPS